MNSKHIENSKDIEPRQHLGRSEREDSSIVLWMILIAAVFFIFVVNCLGGFVGGISEQHWILFRQNQQDGKALTAALTSMHTLNAALEAGWVPKGKEHDEHLELVALIEKHLVLLSNSKILTPPLSGLSRAKSTLTYKTTESLLRHQPLSSTSNQPTSSSKKLTVLMHGAIESTLPRLMQLQVDLLSLPSRILARRKETASMAASLVQAELQIMQVTSFVEQTTSEFAKEQYALLDISINSKSTSLGWKLQIGAAGDSSLLDNWINVDVLGGQARRTKSGIATEIALNVATTPLPFDDDSCEVVYAAHVLEHLEFPGQTFFLLQEVYRVLKPGGTVRIVVPDAAKWITAYNKDRTGKQIPFWLAAREHWPDFNWNDEPLLPLLLAYLGALDNTLEAPNPHRAGFDWTLLSDVLQKVHFDKVVQSSHLGSKNADLLVDDTSEAASAYWITDRGKKEYFSLFVEATKSKE